MSPRGEGRKARHVHMVCMKHAECDGSACGEGEACQECLAIAPPAPDAVAREPKRCGSCQPYNHHGSISVTLCPLHAAAGELARLVEVAIPLLADEWDGTDADSTGNKWLSDARTAIARAKGETG